MAVAYTEKLPTPRPVEFDKTFAGIQFAQQKAQAKKKAIVAQKRARQKEAGDRLSKIAGFDLTEIPIGIRPAVMNMWNDLNAKAPQLLESDDPTALSKMTQSFLNQYNMAKDQLSDEALQKGMDLFESVSTSDQQLAQYNKTLPPFYRADENLTEEFNKRENLMHGLDREWGFTMGADGYQLVFNKEVDGFAQQVPLSDWENYHNAALAEIPQTVSYRSEPTSVGSNNISENMQGRNLRWSKGEAETIAKDIISGNSDDGKDMRSYTAFTFFTEDMQKNPDLMGAFADGDMSAEVFFKNGQQTELGRQVSSFMDKTVDMMVEGSKYVTEEKEETPSSGAQKQTMYLDSMRRESTGIEGMTVNVYDPAASNDVAVDRFAGRVGDIKGEGQAYTLPQSLTLTNFKNPIFGMTDPVYQSPVEGSEDQIISLKDVMKFVAFPPQEGFPEGGIVLRDVSYKNKSYPLTVLDNNQESDKTLIDQILLELRTKSGRTGVELPDLYRGWDAVKVRQGTDSPTGGTSR